MKDKKPYLSFCIPTYNRLDILQNTLESIYTDLKDVDLDDFEVVVSDNELNQSSKGIVGKFEYDNLHYFSTDCEGFLNSFYVLSYGSGSFLKLHNNYTKLRNGSLKLLIREIKDNINNKPVIFYTDGLKQSGKIMKFDSYNSFISELSYFSSWSSGFGIWKEDFDTCSNAIEINKYFPQTSLLLSQSGKSGFIINDKSIFDDQNVPKKGGYNIFKVFSVDYISLIALTYKKGEITIKTFEKIKSNLLLNYLSVRYFKTVIMRLDNFEKNDIKKNIKINYSLFSYYLMIVIALFSPFKFGIRKIKIALFSKNI